MVAVVTAVMFAAACSSPNHHAVTPAPSPDLRGTWQPHAIAGYSGPLGGITWPSPPLLTIARATWFGSDGCNAESGTYQVGTAGRFHASANPENQVGCSNVPNTHVLLSAARTRIIGNHTLVFYSPKGVVLARYVRDTTPKNACSDNGFPPTQVALQLVGGPDNLARALPGTVIATAASTGRTCTVRVGTSGLARLSLRPGLYAVTGHSPLFGSNKYECRAEQQVTFTRLRPGPEPLMPPRIIQVVCEAK